MENKKKKYSLPIYTDGIKSNFTLDFEEGDEKYKKLMEINNEIPLLINVNLKK